MKKVILCIGLIVSLWPIHADDVVKVNKINTEAISSYTLGILPIIIGDSIQVGQFGNSGLPEKKMKLKALLWKYILKNINDYAQFKSSAPCTSVQYSLCKAAMERRGEKIEFSAIKSMQKVDCNYLLLIEIPFVFDDSSSWEYNPEFRFGSISPVRKKPEEERINFGCKFIFYNNSMNRIDYYGTVTAEGNGLRNERQSDFGCWSESIRDLLQQIFEDTEFMHKYKKASDFK
jgi:hypothetical protein